MGVTVGVVTDVDGGLAQAPTKIKIDAIKTQIVLFITTLYSFLNNTPCYKKVNYLMKENRGDSFKV